MSLDDAGLVLAARSGDRAAWAGIYDRYADRLHDFCWSVLRDRDSAADAMQDTFITAYRKLDQLREPARLRSWLFAIARNEALGYAKKRKRAVPTEELEVTATTAGPDDVAQTEELRRLVWSAAAGLADRDRAALDLHLRQGLEGAALGEALGTSADNANVVMSRLRDQVERSMGAYLVAKKGRQDCAALDALLASWDGEFSPLWRKRIARHVDDCPTCDEERRRMVSPLALLAGVPLVAAPADLRDRVLGKLELISASAPIPPAPESRRRRRLVAAVAAALMLLLGSLAAFQLADDDPKIASHLATATTIGPDALPTLPVDGETSTTLTASGVPATPTTQRRTATTVRPGVVTRPTAPPNTTAPPAATTTTTVPLSVTASAGRPGCAPTSVPVTASVRGGRAPYRVAWSWQGAGTSGSGSLNQSGATWNGTMTFASPGDYTWWVTVRDANGTVVQSPQRVIHVDPCPQ